MQKSSNKGRKPTVEKGRQPTFDETKGHCNMADPMSCKSHWVMDASRSAFPLSNPETMGEEMIPVEPRRRPTPHTKVNECDH